MSDIIWLYLGAVGVGMLGCLSATSVRMNKIASLAHIGGIIFTVIYAWRNYGIAHMLTSVLTIFLVGMILAYIVLKIRDKKSKAGQ